MRVHDEWLLLPQRLALHEPTGIAVVADLHLGYSEARRRRGDAVPVPTMASILGPLARAATHECLRGLVVAGDLFERGFDENVYRQFLTVLNELGIGFLGLVPGNHDRNVERHMPDALLWPAGYAVAGWRVHHGDIPLPAERCVAGHVHPAVRWRGRKVPCFLVGPQKVVLPAYSTNAAGVEAGAEMRRLAIFGERLVEVGAGQPVAGRRIGRPSPRRGNVAR